MISTNQEVCWWGTFDNSPLKLSDPVVEWMQFIRNVNRAIRDKHPEIDWRPITDDNDLSKFGGFGEPIQLGQGLHDRVDNQHWTGFEIYPDWIVYLDHDRRQAFIECHNRDMEEIAIRAFEEIHP
jgi:hypothetical protein